MESSLTLTISEPRFVIESSVKEGMEKQNRKLGGKGYCRNQWHKREEPIGMMLTSNFFITRERL